MIPVVLSGEEQQKPMLARCLYKNSPVLILDEPTSALDPISEYEVFSQFQGMLTGKTGIFISHRMGSCKFCSKIFVLDQGRIIQQGSHEQLMQQPEGLYARPAWTKSSPSAGGTITVNATVNNVFGTLPLR